MLVNKLKSPFWDEGSSINSPSCDPRKTDTRSEMKFPATPLVHGNQAVSAITFPMGSNNLYSGSKDESMWVWDCHTGKCAVVIKLEGEVGCMINEGPWIFVGIPNTVKMIFLRLQAWNTPTNAVISLSAHVGQVYSLVAVNRMLFAGMQIGSLKEAYTHQEEHRETLTVFAGIRDEAEVEAINSRGYITVTCSVPGIVREYARIPDEAKALLNYLLNIIGTPPVHGSLANQIVSPDYQDSILFHLGYLEESGTSEPLSVGFHVCRQANVPEYVRIGGAGRSFSDPNQQQQQLYQIERFGDIWPYGVPNPNPNFNSNQYMSSKWGRGNKVTGKCTYSESFSILAQFAGHTEAVSAVISMGSDKFYSGSKDKSLLVWNPQTGQCSEVVKLEGEVGCMINAGSWILVGIPNTVKAWNTQTNVVISLSAPGGPVYALFAGNGMLFAGMQDGNILVWRFNDASATNCFEEIVSLTGHSLSVVSLAVEANRLYSGSMDKTIRVWDLDTLQCIQTLTEHTSAVTSLLCWKQYLISCSLDQTIKVWVASESGTLKVTYTHKEEHGVLGLCGMHDAHANPVLLCSCNDYSVRFYDLPSFNERGKIISMEEIRVIQLAPGGLFFTGNGTGELIVWKWSES